jgi:hypothetical protein
LTSAGAVIGYAVFSRRQKVDSIEAASRTIDPPDRARFQQMVQRIVQTKLEQGQLDE